MKKISLIEDLKLTDAGITRHVIPLLEAVTITDPEIVLDFCNCGVDYPATSLLIDHVLTKISKLPGNKNLRILFDFKIHEFAIHKWFFIGSTFFNIKEDNNQLTLEQLKEVINTKLIQDKIVLEICVLNDDGSQFNSVSYGAN